MRINDVLSRTPIPEFKQVDGFLVNRRGNIGQQVELLVGKIMLNYYCTQCEQIRTFASEGKLSCIFTNKKIISIDCVLMCGCGTKVEVWFLVESESDICGYTPSIRILKRNERLSNLVKSDNGLYGGYSELIEKAKKAYCENLGAGALVYLRKAFEKITIETANNIGISYKKYENGNPTNFRKLLEEVDKMNSIIPSEFSKNGYKLFRELSNVIHGDYDEDKGLKKFNSLYRLVIGILDNVKNRREIKDEIKNLGWEDDIGGISSV